MTYNAVYFDVTTQLSAATSKGSLSSRTEQRGSQSRAIAGRALTCGVATPHHENHVFAGKRDGEVVAWQLFVAGGSKTVAVEEDTRPALQSKLRSLGSHKGGVTCMAYYPARRLLFSGAADSHVCMWDPFQVYQRAAAGPSGCRLQLIPAHDATVTAVAVHCNVVVTGSADKTVKIWMFDDRREGLAIPFLVAKQAFVFDNWITTIFSTLTKATEVQAEDIYVGDASGNVTSLHSVMAPLLQKGAVEDNGVLQVELIRHTRLVETAPLQAGAGDTTPKSITAILPLPTINSMVTLGYDNYALITDAAKGATLGKIEHPESAGATGAKAIAATRFVDILFLAAREEMILLDNYGTLYLWDTRTNQYLCSRKSTANRRSRALLNFQHTGAQPAYLRASDECFMVLHDDGVELLNVVHVKAVTELKGHEGRVLSVQVNHLSEYAALAGGHAGSEGDPAQHANGSASETQDVAFVTAGVDNKVCMWSSRLSLIRSFTEKFSEISSFCFLPHLGFCVTGHDNGSVKFWGLSSDRSSRFTAHDNTVSCIAEGLHRYDRRSDGIVPWSHIFTTSYDGCLAVWEMPLENSKPKCEGRVRVSNSELVCGVYDTMQYAYVVGDNDGSISMWSVDDLKPIRRFLHAMRGPSGPSRGVTSNGKRPAHSEAVTTIALDGNIAASGGEDTQIFLWNAASGECLKEFNTTAAALELPSSAASGWGEIQQLHVNAETGDIVACTRSGVVLQFSQSTGLPTSYYKAQSEVSALCLNPYGKEVILGLESGMVVRTPMAMFKPLTLALENADVEYSM